MKIGDKVVCINIGFYEDANGIQYIKGKGLIYNKIYTIINKKGEEYIEVGNGVLYHVSRFKLLSTMRMEKINYLKNKLINEQK